MHIQESCEFLLRLLEPGSSCDMFFFFFPMALHRITIDLMLISS